MHVHVYLYFFGYHTIKRCDKKQEQSVNPKQKFDVVAGTIYYASLRLRDFNRTTTERHHYEHWRIKNVSTITKSICRYPHVLVVDDVNIPY